MPKGLFFSVPSVSVSHTLTPVIDEISAGGYSILYYSTADFQPSGNHLFSFRAYPANFNGYYSDRIDENTSYFQFAEILIRTASELMDFLISEVEREKPDFIIHSHLAIWGKLLAGHYKLPAITLFTTFILDKRIMLPFFRGMQPAHDAGLHHVHTAVNYYRTCLSLYARLRLEEKPDPWDAPYINAEATLICLLLPRYFQPQRQLLPNQQLCLPWVINFSRDTEKKPKAYLYIAMGTIPDRICPVQALY